MPRIAEFYGIAVYLYNDGTQKRVNVWPLLDAPIFEPLRDPTYFARVILDPVAGTVVWPNEADFAPDALYELEIETGVEELARHEPPSRALAVVG